MLYIENLEYRRCFSVMGPSPSAELQLEESIPLLPPIDVELQSLYMQYSADGVDATEMKSLILFTKDNDYIDRFEILQLKNYITDAEMKDHVRYLSDAIVNGHETNDLFAGNPINIESFNFSTVDILIDKWFNGKDLPKWYNSTPYYAEVEGQLFVDGIKPSDARQGDVGDCYFITALNALSQTAPKIIENFFIEISHNVWAVRFFDNAGEAHYVTVNNEFAINRSREHLFAHFGGLNADDISNELWPALIEKAYVQVSQNKLIRNGSNTYNDIALGDSGRALLHLTNKEPLRIKGIGKQAYIDYIQQNKPITVSHNAQRHTYTIESYNAEEDKFFLRNPWQHSHIYATWEELEAIPIVGSAFGGYVFDINAENLNN